MINDVEHLLMCFPCVSSLLMHLFKLLFFYVVCLFNMENSITCNGWSKT